MRLYLILLYILVILYDLSVVRPLIGATAKSMKLLVDFIAGKIQFVSFDQSNNSVVIDLKINLILMKNHPIMPNLSFSSKLPWSSYSFSFFEAVSRKIGAFILSWSFFPRLLGASINILYNLAWNTVFMTGLVLLVTNWILW